MSTAIAGYRMLAATYDEAPNPLPALEMRLVRRHVGAVAGLRVLDAGCGTGRWMRELRLAGARVTGVDACEQMVRREAGCVALGDVRHLPFPDGVFDLAVCSLTLGYVPDAAPVIEELARVSPRVIVTDLHPAAATAGWTRSFRAGDQVVTLPHYPHSSRELDASARRAGLTLEWRGEACFGEAERAIFDSAGKPERFAAVAGIPAVLATIWRR